MTFLPLQKLLPLLAVSMVLATPPGQLRGNDQAGSAPRLINDLVNPVHSEVNLGEFVVPVPFADSNSSITLFCKLFVTVRINEQGKFEEELKLREARLRDRVIVAMRGVTRDDLYDRDLTSLKEKLRAAIQGAIESPSIYRVGFLSFQYNEE